MIALTLLLYFQDAEDTCEVRVRAFPDGETQTVAAMGGTCDVASVTPGPDAMAVVRGEMREASVWRFIRDEVEDLGSPGWVRQVAWSAEGELLALTADADDDTVNDDGAVFTSGTWAWREGEWVSLERTEERLRTVRAVVGGPIWQARQAGASVDAWTTERAEGFRLGEATEVKLPKKHDMGGTILYGIVPLPKTELAIRYTILGVPSAVGPVYARKGKKWTVLDDHRFAEVPASIQGSGDYRLLSYEGMNPALIDAQTAKVVWRPGEDEWVMGAMLR